MSKFGEWFKSLFGNGGDQPSESAPSSEPENAPFGRQVAKANLTGTMTGRVWRAAEQRWEPIPDIQVTVNKMEGTA